MAKYIIYVGAERKDRATTEAEKQDVIKLINSSLMKSGSCYSVIRHNEKYIGQAEHVLDNLVSIAYIPTLEDVAFIANQLKEIGISKYTKVTCDDDECLNEIENQDIVLSV